MTTPSSRRRLHQSPYLQVSLTAVTPPRSLRTYHIPPFPSSDLGSPPAPLRLRLLSPWFSFPRSNYRLRKVRPDTAWTSCECLLAGCTNVRVNRHYPDCPANTHRYLGGSSGNDPTVFEGHQTWCASLSTIFSSLSRSSSSADVFPCKALFSKSRSASQSDATVLVDTKMESMGT